MRTRGTPLLEKSARINHGREFDEKCANCKQAQESSRGGVISPT